MIFLLRRLPLLVLVLWTSALILAAQGNGQPGKVPFDRICATCHGEDARGAAALGIVPYEKEYYDLLVTVRDGSGEMPGLSSKQVTDEEVQQVFDYLKSLSKAGVSASVSHVRKS